MLNSTPLTVPAFARRGKDGLAQIGPSRFDLEGVRFFNGEEGAGGDAPTETPVKEMTPDQQVAFHQAKARKLEDKLKGFGGFTPEQVQKMQKDLDEAREASQTAEQRALEEAKQSGRQEVIGLLATERVTNALERKLIGRDVDPAKLLTLDRSSFIDGDKADMAKIDAWVSENTTETKAPTANIGRFQGRHEQIETTGRATGEAEAERRFGKKS